MTTIYQKVHEGFIVYLWVKWPAEMTKWQAYDELVEVLFDDSTEAAQLFAVRCALSAPWIGNNGVFVDSSIEGNKSDWAKLRSVEELRGKYHLVND